MDAREIAVEWAEKTIIQQFHCEGGQMTSKGSKIAMKVSTRNSTLTFLAPIYL